MTSPRALRNHLAYKKRAAWLSAIFHFSSIFFPPSIYSSDVCVYVVASAFFMRVTSRFEFLINSNLVNDSLGSDWLRWLDGKWRVCGEKV